MTGYDVDYTASTTAADDAPAGTDAAAGWKPVPRSGTAASQSITGLVGRDYRVRVRAAYAAGKGPWVTGAGRARTLWSSWSSTLTVRSHGHLTGCDGAVAVTDDGS